jgi:hypothetical protein
MQVARPIPEQSTGLLTSRDFQQTYDLPCEENRFGGKGGEGAGLSGGMTAIPVHRFTTDPLPTGSRPNMRAEADFQPWTNPATGAKA